MHTCDCFKGTPGDSRYEPSGKFETLDGLKTYVSSPKSSDGSVNNVRGHILYLPDGFGHAQHNFKLADMYASRGYKTTIVDYFEGDGMPDVFMKYIPGTDLDSYDNITAEEKEVIRGVDIHAWLSRHDSEIVGKLMQRFFPEYIKSVQVGEFNKDVHVLGHCFGGKHTFNVAQSDTYPEVKSCVTFHPANQTPEDMQNLKRPIFVGLAETDVFTPEIISDMHSALPKSGAMYKLSMYGGTRHGFATRPDLDTKKSAKMFYSAFEDGLRWMEEAAGSRE